MTDGILALNAGASSLKFSLFVTTSGADALSLIYRGEVEGIGDHPCFLYEYIARVLPDYLGALADGRVVAAHLGSGASMCAMRGRESQATTMGFTALDGLPMGTRCGAIDPGVILYLLSEQRMDDPTVTDLLYSSLRALLY